MPDYIVGNAVHGSVAMKLSQNGFDPRCLRPWVNKQGHAFVVNGAGQVVTANNSLLRKDEWKEYDRVVVQVARERLVAVDDLLSRGLTYNISNGMGKSVLEYEDISDMEDASLTMDALADNDKDRLEYDLKFLPLPILHKDFGFSARFLSTARSNNNPLDTTHAQVAARKVAELAEDLLVNGVTNYNFGGGTIYGYTTFPSRNTVSLSLNWDDASKTGEQILADVLAMKQAAIDDNFFGPYVLYIPTNYETVLDEDFKANSDKTIRQRLLEIDSITEIKVIDKLSDDNVLLVQMTSDVIREVIGMMPTTMQWDEKGGLYHQFKVMAIMIPQPRADQEGKCGIVHLA
jgi:uncharacterized linocin/CFP29 family protein